MLRSELEQFVNELFGDYRTSECERMQALREVESLPRFGQSLLRDHLEASSSPDTDFFWETIANLKSFCKIKVRT